MTPTESMITRTVTLSDGTAVDARVRRSASGEVQFSLGRLTPADVECFSDADKTRVWIVMSELMLDAGPRGLLPVH